ncbi:MAG: general secretion pathway protein D [Candidatus Azotimanducaceae bacterium]|jgi:general secretion pathway protein D
MTKGITTILRRCYRALTPLPVLLGLSLLQGCIVALDPPQPKLSDGHLSTPKQLQPDDTNNTIPEFVLASPSLPVPQPVLAPATHTVVVFDVPVRELLFSLARDSDLNLDIDSEISSTISLNAVEQPLPAILDRIANSANLRYELRNNTLSIKVDSAFLKSYSVDYLNISRRSVGSVAVSTQISSTGQGGDEAGGAADNSSDTVVTSITNHAFWQTLRTNISGILGQSSSSDTEAGADSANIIFNSESGTIAIRATQRQHKDIAAFLERVQLSTQRQVLIEATIAEVNLNDSYQAGINWNLINPDNSSGVEISQNFNDISLSTPPAISVNVSDLALGGNQLQATLQALETFGDVTVMSSPKVMAMNNQTALLKVVDNLIYFTVEVNIDTSAAGIGGGGLTTFQTEVNTVPVGFVMSVTPYIDAAGSVILNVRPTISRVINFVRDPNPALASVDVVSEIPVIQIREVESVLKVRSGDIAVIGGLMQDEVKRSNRGVPLLGKIPLIGNAFRYDDDQTSKTELVIFLKPTVIENASIDGGDLQNFKQFLPTNNQP